MRTFVAVPISVPKRVRQLLTDLDQFGSVVKTASADSMHVTLKFLGETRKPQLPEIRRAIELAAETEPAFTSQLVGLGAFPNVFKPTVLWIGLKLAEPLMRIAGRLEAECATLGFETENRPFVPHLTLARFKGHVPSEVREWLESESQTEFGAAPIGSIVHYKSELTADGPVYAPVWTHLLESTEK